MPRVFLSETAAMINTNTIVHAFGALAARRRGERLNDIAMRYGVSRERARQLSQLGFVVERERDSGDPWYELAPRTRNGLVGDGCVPTLDGIVAELGADIDPFMLHIFLIKPALFASWGPS